MSGPARWAVTGMTCAACATRLERVVTRVEGVECARVDFATGTLVLEGTATEAGVRGALERAGLGGRPAEEAAPEGVPRGELVRVAVAAAFGMQAMTLGVVVVSEGLPAAWVTPLGVLAGVLSAPAVLWAGAPLLRATAVGLRAGGIGVDALVGLGVLLTWSASWLSVLAGHAEVWFDTAAMLVALHVGGRVVEAGVRRRATGAVRALLTLVPAVATRETAGGGVEEVGVGFVRPGDRVHVRAGTRLPVDGVVLRGRSAVDRSLLNGEPLAEEVGPGALVEAGTLNGEGALVIEVTAAEGRRRVDTLRAAVERALAGRPAVVRAADRVARGLVPAIGVLALGVGVVRALGGAGPAEALVAAATVVVITCPCALTLAAPLAVAAAASAAAERGFLFRDADAIERLATATAAWFDKTGTLTEGAATVRALEVRGELSAAACLDRAAGLAAASSHPAARAVLRERPGALPAPEAVVRPGDGVEARLDGVTWRLGRPGWASGAGPAAGPAVDLTRDGELLARLHLGDPLRPDAARVVAGLRARGLEVRVLSGDPSGRVAEVARALGVEDARAGMAPEAKGEAVAAARARVAFIGDGANDAVAHGAAWVGIAPAGSVDLAARSAGVVLLRDGLEPLLDAVDLARAARRVIRQNLGWAVAYNLVAVPFALAGSATPLLAAAAMTLSSLTVTANAARLLGGGGTRLAHDPLPPEAS